MPETVIARIEPSRGRCVACGRPGEYAMGTYAVPEDATTFRIEPGTVEMKWYCADHVPLPKTRKFDDGQGVREG